ncbi:MAG: carboxypeptidase-like regulatory domain-containing protein [Flavobacteriia bacterium]|jgi:hypothetical protein
MKKIHLLLFSSFILFLSCKKKNADFVIKGLVSDATFSQPLSNATVKLYQIPVGSTEEVLIASSKTDAQGNYTFSFPREKMEKYRLLISKSNYFLIDEIIYFSELSLESDYIENCSTTAMSWAKLTFHNLNPQAVDHLQYIKQSGKNGCMECCPTSYQDYYGSLDTSIYCINDGNTDYSYLYWVLGTSDQGSRTVFTTAFDTSEVILNY